MIQLNGDQTIELVDASQNSLIHCSTPTVIINVESLRMEIVVQTALTADSHIQLETRISGILRMQCADVTLTDNKLSQSILTYSNL